MLLPILNCLKFRGPKAFMVLVIALATGFLPAPSAQAAEGGGSKKSAFGPGEHELQLPPIWIPVNIHKNRSGAPQYAPVTVNLTSRDGGMMNMCYRLPYIIEALVFALHETDVKMDRQRNIDTTGLDGLALDAAIKATDRKTVKSIKVVSGTPHPTASNQDMLSLCR